MHPTTYKVEVLHKSKMYFNKTHESETCKALMRIYETIKEYCEQQLFVLTPQLQKEKQTL